MFLKILAIIVFFACACVAWVSFLRFGSFMTGRKFSNFFMLLFIVIIITLLCVIGSGLLTFLEKTMV